MRLIDFDILWAEQRKYFRCRRCGKDADVMASTGGFYCDSCAERIFGQAFLKWKKETE